MSDLVKVIFEAMESELERSKRLKIKGYKEKPYYISYLLKESESYDITSEEGTIISLDNELIRDTLATVRVGSYNNDSFGGAYLRLNCEKPVDKNSRKRIKANIKRGLWLISDMAFKVAIEMALHRKLKRVEEERNAKSLFSKEKPEVHIEDYEPLKFNVKEWTEKANEISYSISRNKDVLNSSVDIGAKKDWDYFINTEGTKIFQQHSYYRIILTANMRSIDQKTGKEDGGIVKNFKVYNLRKKDEIPPLEVFLKDGEKLIQQLKLMRRAEKINVSKTQLAILDQTAHGTLWHEVIGHRFELTPNISLEEDEQIDFRAQEMITNEFITIEMDPTLERFQNTALYGHYKYDDQGAKSQKVTLIENGITKDFLKGRHYNGYGDIKNHKSNGHARCQDPTILPNPRMSNLIVKPKHTCSPKRLKEMLIEECKKQGREYGLIIDDSEGGYTELEGGNFKITPKLIYKVDVSTGKETLVRGISIIGTRHHALEEIIAMDNDYKISTGMCGSISGWVPVSEIAPRLLTKVEVISDTNQNIRSQILPPPKDK